MQAKGETAAQTQQITQKEHVPMEVNSPSPTGANTSSEIVRRPSTNHSKPKFMV